MEKENKSYEDIPETAEVTGNVEEIIDPEKTDERIWLSLQKGDMQCELPAACLRCSGGFLPKPGDILCTSISVAP